jgi:carbonic anhydrase
MYGTLMYRLLDVKVVLRVANYILPLFFVTSHQGEKPGSVFVVRNVANMVIATDVNLKGALQFAVTVLQVKHIIVCGHYDCGGIRASMRKQDVGGPLEMWLKSVRDVYRTHKLKLDAIPDPEDRHRRMVEINAVEQAVNLFKTGVVQNQRIVTAKDDTCNFAAPRIHACVFDPKDGRLKNLDINWSEYLKDIRDVYEMYSGVDELGVLNGEIENLMKLPAEDAPEDEMKKKMDALKVFFGIGE